MSKLNIYSVSVDYHTPYASAVKFFCVKAKDEVDAEAKALFLFRKRNRQQLRGIGPVRVSLSGWNRD